MRARVLNQDVDPGLRAEVERVAETLAHDTSLFRGDHEWLSLSTRSDLDPPVVLLNGDFQLFGTCLRKSTIAALTPDGTELDPRALAQLNTGDVPVANEANLIRFLSLMEPVPSMVLPWLTGFAELAISNDVMPSAFSLAFCEKVQARSEDKIVIDAGAGMGLQAMRALHTGARHVFAIDNSAAAMDALGKTVQQNHLDHRFTLIEGDILDFDPPEKVDLVIANPPTRPDLPGVPDMAKGGGADGTEFLFKLGKKIQGWLKPGGHVQIIFSDFLPDAAKQEFAQRAGVELKVIGRSSVKLADYVPLPEGTVRPAVEGVTVYEGVRMLDGPSQQRPVTGCGFAVQEIV